MRVNGYRVCTWGGERVLAMDGGADLPPLKQTPKNGLHVNLCPMHIFQLNEHEFEQTPGDSEGQGSLTSCSSWGRKESDMTKGLNSNNHNKDILFSGYILWEVK